MFPTDTRFLMAAYEDATERPYGHLLIDLSPSGNDSIRIRGNIMDSVPIIYSRKKLKIHCSTTHTLFSLHHDTSCTKV